MMQLQNKRKGVSGNFPEITAGYLCCQPKISAKKKNMLKHTLFLMECELD
jgi:hypothetical protein